MASLVQKFRTLISANLHSLFDKALQSQSLAVLDEYIRRMTEQMRELYTSIEKVAGNIKTVQRRHGDLSEKAEDLNAAVDAFLLKGQNAQALAAQSRLNALREMMETYQREWQRLHASYRTLDDVYVKIEARFLMVKQEREELGHLLDLAKSREQLSRTIRSLDDLTGQGDADVARVAEGIRQRLDEAEAHNEVLLGSLDRQMEDALASVEVEAQLEERRQRLGME
ncbi:MAG: PspA/IM30 family protein [Anaerolineae bacterium]|jgi:phage shock protein A|nr:PspA/IM30 family protein [Anaerolineae bacterium]